MSVGPLLIYLGYTVKNALNLTFTNSLSWTYSNMQISENCTDFSKFLV